jgi:hypothetical protein
MDVEHLGLSNGASAHAENMQPSRSPLDTCALSVIVGSLNSERSIVRVVAALERSCSGLDAEIIIVDASGDDTVSRISTEFASAGARQLHRLPVGTLTPVLWSTGFAKSRGRVVAFTTGHCEVGEEWARALLAGIDTGATGVAGALSLHPDASATDEAVFYLRYSTFLTGANGAAQKAEEIPGDNAAYRRDSLDRHAASFGGGFWEVDFHRRIRAEGEYLAFVPNADVRFGPSAPLTSYVRQRFAHGCFTGSWRVKTGVRSMWQVVGAAPLVPFVLMARIARRVMPRRADRGRFLHAVPPLLALATAWAAGEAYGAVTRGHD